MEESIEVNVGKLRFRRLRNAVEPLRPFRPNEPAQFLVCVDPHWNMFVFDKYLFSRGSKDPAKLGKYLMENAWEEFIFYEDRSPKEIEEMKIEDLMLEPAQEEYEFEYEPTSQKDMLLEPEQDIYFYLNYLTNHKNLRVLADQILEKYKEAKQEKVEQYRAKYKRLRYPAVRKQFDDLRERWGLNDERNNFFTLIESSSKTVCLSNWIIVNSEFWKELAEFLSYIRCSPKAMQDVGFIMIFLLFEKLILTKQCYFIPLFPKIEIRNSPLGARVFAEIDLESDAEDYDNYSQLVKIIKSIELGYVKQKKEKPRFEYPEALKYEWDYLHKQGISWNKIAEMHKSQYPDITRERVRKAVERLWK